MKEKIIVQMLGLLIRLVTGERLRQLADVILDFFEDGAKDSKNKFDDATVLPLCKAIRKTFGIPDGD